MNRPSASDYALGNPLSIVALFCVAFYMTARWCLQWDNHESFSCIFPAAALLVCKHAGNARRRIAAFRQWQGAWNAMSGEDQHLEARKRARQRVGQVVLAVPLWLLLVGWLLVHGAEPWTPAHFGAVAIVLTLSAWGARGILRPVMRWRRVRPASARRAREFIVVVCVSPRTSPSPQRIAALLPDYCKALLANSSADAPYATD
jgi:hypothetical protein